MLLRLFSLEQAIFGVEKVDHPPPFVSARTAKSGIRPPKIGLFWYQLAIISDSRYCRTNRWLKPANIRLLVGCFVGFPFSRWWPFERFTAISMSTGLRNVGIQMLSAALISYTLFDREQFQLESNPPLQPASNTRTHCGGQNECYLSNTLCSGTLRAISHLQIGVTFGGLSWL